MSHNHKRMLIQSVVTCTSLPVRSKQRNGFLCIRYWNSASSYVSSFLSCPLMFLYALTFAFCEIPLSKSRNRDTMDNFRKRKQCFNHKSYVSSVIVLSLLTFSDKTMRHHWLAVYSFSGILYVKYKSKMS
jgi:hypothetical protein